MFIKSKTLSKIIKEELDNEMKAQKLGQTIISIFATSETFDELYQNLQDLGVEPTKAIYSIKPDSVDPQFFQESVQMHNEMVKNFGEGKEI
jgi:hypothetical protein